MEDVWIAAGFVGVLLLLAIVGLWAARTSDASESMRAHEAAREREPPVEIGETYEFGVVEFTDHHTGERVAVGKVEGFVLFASGVPDSLETGDVVRAKVLSFNKGRTSADAKLVEAV